MSALDRRPQPREICIAAGTLLLVALALYGPYIVNGGFVIDDWGHAAGVAHPNNGILSDYWQVTSNRPVLVVYVPLTHLVFGANPELHIAWSILLAVSMSVALYVLLRKLGLETFAAGAIALLVLLFPWSDASRFWTTASHINLGITFGLLGAILALRGLEERAAGLTGRAQRLHITAVALYALSVLTYEIAGVVLLLVGAIYLSRAAWPTVRKLWAIDFTVILGCLAWSGIRSDRARPPLSQMLEHARDLADGGLSLLSSALVPFGNPGRDTLLLLLGAIFLAAIVVWRSLPENDAARRDLRKWLIAAAGGVIVAGAGWVLYIAADPYYQVSSPGVGNRTNVMAALGIVVVVYAALATVAILLLRGLPGWRRNAALLTSALALIVGAGYARELSDDRQAWSRAADGAEEVLSAIETSVPSPRHGSTIYTFNHPGSETTGVVIFAFSWDLQGAVELVYDDPTLAGYPILEGVEIRCGPRTTGPSGPEWSTELHGAPYGLAYFVDVQEDRAKRIDSRRECVAARPHFPPGPTIRPDSA